jgi:hypothetical protein
LRWRFEDLFADGVQPLCRVNGVLGLEPVIRLTQVLPGGGRDDHPIALHDSRLVDTQRREERTGFDTLSVTGRIQALADSRNRPGVLDPILNVLPSLGIHDHQGRFAIDRQHRRTSDLLEVGDETRGVVGLVSAAIPASAETTAPTTKTAAMIRYFMVSSL